MSEIEYETIKKASEKYRTPLYLVNIDRLVDRYNLIKSSFPQDTKIAYAMKANYTQTLLKKLHELGSNFDIFSPGELKILEMSDCKPEKVNYTSVAETENEFKYALNKGVKRFVLGSINGISNLSKALDQNNKKEDIEILLRTQPIKKVNAAVSTSGEESKFGVLFTEDRDSVENALEKLDEENLDFSGFHFHLGSKIESPRFYIEAINKALEFAESRDIDLKILDLGGGYPVDPLNKEKPVKRFGKRISEEVKKWREKIGDFELIIEPGRSLASKTTILIVRVVNVKGMYGEKTVIVDGSEDMVKIGRHDTETYIETISENEKLVKSKIAGNLCHSEDWLVSKPKEMPDLEIGDLVIFKNLGAYFISQNLSYNLRKIPDVISLQNDEMKKEKHPIQLLEKTNKVYENPK